VGSSKTLSVDVRLIAATNKNLEEQVKAGKFREDLFFRLRVVELRLPPLRDRLEDIPLLARTFLREFSQENNKPVQSFTSDAFELLMQYPWPGNVRELRTAVEHGVVLCRGDKITVRDLPASIREMVGQAPAEKDTKRLLAQDGLTAKEAERELMIRALKATSGHRTLAARRLGMSRRTFHRRLHEHHLEEM
jgi:DNA-binding NtrC family response regulator